MDSDAQADVAGWFLTPEPLRPHRRLHHSSSSAHQTLRLTLSQQASAEHHHRLPTEKAALREAQGPLGPLFQVLEEVPQPEVVEASLEAAVLVLAAEEAAPESVRVVALLATVLAAPQEVEQVSQREALLALPETST